MRKSLVLLAISCLLLCCSSGPEDVAKNFAENLAKGKVEEAKKYATQSTGKMLDFTSGFGGLPIEPNFKFELVKDSIVGNRAWITFKDEKGNEQILEAVKIDGDWLIHMESKK